MKYNSIGIDPSIISTAVVVNGKIFNYTRKSDVFNKKEEYTKWFDIFKNEITYKFIDLDYLEGYSKNEIQKIKLYNKITDNIILDIDNNLIKNLPIKILLEGFSYSSSFGPLIDLVTFSTLLRNKLLKLTDDIIILSPASLKLESCKLTYPPKNIGKKKPKFEYRNNLGVAGGSFSKIDIYLSLIENDNFNDSYCNLLRSLKSEIMELKTIKKPLEDANDAYLLYLLSKLDKY